MRSSDVVIIGAGAAGLMCALTAGKRGRRVLLLDHANKAGKKILMSGGGRCNFTNTYTDPANFFSQNPHFCKSALARYSPWDFIAMVSEHGVPYHEKKLGQLFCDNKSRDIRDMLLEECQRAGVELHLDTVGAAHRENRGRIPVEHRPGSGRHRSRWSSPPAACRFRRWAPPASATRSPASSATPCCRPAPGWCRSSSPTGSRSCAPSCPAPRWPAWSAATARASARTSCSPTAASAARPCCRSPRSGNSATPWRSTCCPTTTLWSGCRAFRPRGPTAS